jgi:translation initiation factor 3 subunit A
MRRVFCFSFFFFFFADTQHKKNKELLAINQSDAALAALNAVISSKRHRVWSKVMEQVMLRYVDLGVELVKAKEAKEGLYQYRIVCVGHPESLELISERLVSRAEAAALDSPAARRRRQTAVDDSYEASLLAGVSGLSAAEQLESQAGVAAPQVSVGGVPQPCSR